MNLSFRDVKNQIKIDFLISKLKNKNRFVIFISQSLNSGAKFA